MPELPEVEAARVLARRVALGRRITRVWCAGDPIVFEARRPTQVRRALLGRRVRGVGRHGKHLWLELDRRPWPCFHFGMAGGFRAPRARGARLVASGKRDTGDAWPPRFAKLRLTFDDGGELVMTDARRLGRIRLRADPRAEPPVSELGFDALLGLPAPARFADLPAPVDEAQARWAVANCALQRRRFGVADLAMLLGAWEDDDVDAVLAAAEQAAGGGPEAAGGGRAAGRAGDDGARAP